MRGKAGMEALWVYVTLRALIWTLCEIRHHRLDVDIPVGLTVNIMGLSFSIPAAQGTPSSVHIELSRQLLVSVPSSFLEAPRFPTSPSISSSTGSHYPLVSLPHSGLTNEWMSVTGDLIDLASISTLSLLGLGVAAFDFTQEFLHVIF